MRVQIHAADTGGCGYYRLRWAGEALQAQGADIVFGETLPAVYQDTPDGTPVMIGVRCDADVVVLQRVLSRDVYETIPFLQAQGVAVVVEIDDHFHALPRSNPAYTQTDPAGNPDYSRSWLQRACDIADLVTCTTPGLASQYAKHGRVQIIPNYARARWLDLPAPDPRPATIGWTGAVVTHRGDLDEAAAAVRSVLRTAPDWKFHALGSDRVRTELRLAPNQFQSAGWADLQTDDYPQAIQQIGVGIVPLRPSAFNRLGKSWLKGLEYAACGVPFVASRVGDYERLARILTVPLAHGRAEWHRQVDRFVTDTTWREQVAGVNRERVRQQLTIEGNLDRWMDAWRQARANRTRS